MHDVLGFNIARNGAFSALPFVASLSFGPVSGLFADWLRFKLSTTVVRSCSVLLDIVYSELFSYPDTIYWL